MLAAVAREIRKEHPRNGQSRTTSVASINQEHIKQLFEETEGKDTEKLSHEFSRTESRILGALSKLDEFFLNPQVRPHSGTVPGTFQNTNVENQEPNEDHSQDDRHPEMGSSVYHSRHSIDLDADEAPHRNNVFWYAFYSKVSTFDDFDRKFFIYSIAFLLFTIKQTFTAAVNTSVDKEVESYITLAPGANRPSCQFFGICDQSFVHKWYKTTPKARHIKNIDIIGHIWPRFGTTIPSEFFAYSVCFQSLRILQQLKLSRDFWTVCLMQRA